MSAAVKRFVLKIDGAPIDASLVRKGLHLWLVELPGGVQAWVRPDELSPRSADALVPHRTRAERLLREQGKPCDPSSYDVGGAS